MLINASKPYRITVGAKSLVDGAEFYGRVLKCGEGKGCTFRLTIPKEVAEVMGLEKGDMLHVTIRKVKPPKPKRGE